MSSFLTQSYDEQITTLTHFAHDALHHWGLSDSTLQFIAYTSNAVFRVSGKNGDFALRIHRPNHKSLAWIESERLWVDWLSQNPNLNVPRSYLDIYHGQLLGVEGAVYGTLNHWLEGQPRELDALTAKDLQLIGQNIAHFHNSASTFVPPTNFNRPRLDWDGLFSAGGAYDPKDGMRFFLPEHLALIDSATAIIQHTMTTLDQENHTFGLIHGDLISKNILFNDDQIIFLDFEDSAYGYYLYDLTPIIWLGRNTPQAPSIMTHLWDGYQAVRPQPTGYRDHLEVFVMARHIASCRWVAGNAEHPYLRGKVGDIIATRMIELKTYLERITKQPYITG
jgi:Ser/Thr protein kinase RdoA (MazF antagonist)